MNITRIHPERCHHPDEEPIEAFFARRGRRAGMQLAPFHLGHDEMLSELEPGRLAWRAAGCPIERRVA